MLMGRARNDKRDTVGRFTPAFERFRDHHLSKGSKFDDWQAAWGTWVRNSVDFGRSRSPPQPENFLDVYERERKWRKEATG
jgi:hypothetical protein